MHFQKVAQVAGQQEKKKDDGAGEHNPDKAFGQDIQCNESRNAPTGEKTGFSGLPAVEKKVEYQADPNADSDVGDKDAGEEIRTAASKKHYGGPETCSFG